MFGKYIIKHSRFILVISFILLIAGIFLASTMTMATNMSDMLPSDHEFIQANADFEQAFGSGEKVYIAVSGEKALRHKLVKSLFDYLVEIKSESIEDTYAGDVKAEKYIDSKDGKLTVMIVTPKLDGQDYVNSRNAFFGVLDDAIAAVKGSEGVDSNQPFEIAYTGGAFVLDYEADIVMESGIFSSIGWVLGLILVLLVFSFRRISLPLLLFYPLLLGVVLSFAVGVFIFDTFNLFTVFFAAVLFGLGIDFAIHLFSRYEALRYQGMALETALMAALKSTGTGIVIGALTTVVAFMSFTFASFKGFAQMGIFAAIGIAILAFSMLCLVPALIVVFDGRHVYQQRAQIQKTARASKSKLWVLMASRFGILALLVGGLGFFSQGHFDYNIASIYPESMKSTLWQQRLEEAFDTKLETLTVVMPNFEALKNAESQFEKQSSGQNRTLSTNSILTEIPKAIRPTTEAELSKVLAVVPDFVAKNFVNGNGEYRLDLVPSESVTNLDDYKTLESHVRSVTGQQPVGFLALMMTLSDLVMTDIGLLSALCLGFTLFVLLVTFKRGSVAILLTSGLALTLLSTWGLTSLMAVSVNIVSVIAYPILIGIGIDGFVHITHRLLEQDSNENYSDAVKALTLTTLTTVIGFGSLAFVNHGGLSNLGKIVMVGMSIGYLIQVFLMPVAINALRNLKIIKIAEKTNVQFGEL